MDNNAHFVDIRRHLKSETLGMKFLVTYRFEVEINEPVPPPGKHFIWRALTIHSVHRVVGGGGETYHINWEQLPDENGFEEMLLEVWDELRAREVFRTPLLTSEDFDTDFRERTHELRRELDRWAHADNYDLAS